MKRKTFALLTCKHVHYLKAKIVLKQMVTGTRTTKHYLQFTVSYIKSTLQLRKA